MPFVARTSFFIVFGLVIVGCQPNPTGNGSSTAQSADDLGIADVPDAIEVIEVPPTGVYLGWGWNKPDHEPIPTICVEFVQGEEPAQTRFMTMKEVSDSFEVMESMGMSAEASVKTIGFKAEGKASFAKSVNVTGSSSTFVLNAEVHNGVRYAAPVPYDAQGEIDERRLSYRGGSQGAIRLTPDAERLAAKPDRTDFKRMCGTGFVSAIYSGARLTAVLTTQTESKSEKETLSASMTGSGWGAKFKASVNGEAGSEIQMDSFELTLFQTGGRGDAIPATKDDLRRKLETISFEAYEAPKDFNIAITPYEVLSNWPKKGLVNRDTEFDELASYWGAYNTLYDEIQAILENPGEYASVNLDASGCVVVTNDEPEANAITETDLIRLVAEYEDLRDLPAIQVQGIGRVSLVPEPGAYMRQSQGFYNAVRRMTENYEPATNEADRSQNLHALKVAQDEIVAKLKTMEDVARDCVSKSDTCDFRAEDYRSPFAFRLQLLPPNGFATTSTDVIELFVEDSAKRRCAISPNNTACITNAEISAWQEKIGLTPVHKAGNEELYDKLTGLLASENSVTRLACADGTLASPLLSEEPGFDVIWANLPAIEAKGVLDRSLADLDPEEIDL